MRENVARFMRGAGDFLNKLRDDTSDGISDLRTRMQNPLASNQEIGLSHYYAGRYGDAILRFKIMNIIWGESFFTTYNLGRCYLAKGWNSSKYEKALHYFDKALVFEPGNQLVQYCMQKINNPHDIERIPNELAQEKRTFDFINILNVAEHEIEAYDGLACVATAHDNPMGMSVLDLGCGVGAVGKSLRRKYIGRHIYGVDPSQKMVDYSKSLKNGAAFVYTSVLHEDIYDFLGTHSEQFDCIVAFGILEFYGDLGVLLKLCRKALRAQGVLVLTTLRSQSGAYIGFVPDLDCFFYSMQYIEDAANSAGFNLVREENLELKNGNYMIQCVLCKGP